MKGGNNMGGRFLLTGVQLGMLSVYVKEGDTHALSIGGQGNGQALINQILENQYVGESDQAIMDDVDMVKDHIEFCKKDLWGEPV